MSESLHIPYIDEGFSVSHAENCHLALQLIGDAYSMAIFCPEQHLRLMLQWQGEDRDSRVDHILSLQYVSRKVSLELQPSTLVPQDLFDLEHLDDLYPILGLDKSTHLLHVDHIPHEKIVVISGLENKRSDQVHNAFPKEKIVASASAFLNAVLASSVNDQASLYINFAGKFTEFIYIQDGQLIFFSQFPNNDVDEFNYFLLSCAQELGIQLEDIVLSLSGSISSGDEYYLRCKKYNKEVRFSSPNAFIDQELPSQLPEPHRFFSLFGLTLCV
ncbi:DUF3822 family protein [Olivibacter sitiensis]|uniref:DUF3822 family protein n=1 Tax=Olivibacter sitiensis TaxID=376470 RepID=UPI0004288AAE|nr:DUF3822 family protein [Olivibacter sitiensis]